MQTVREISSERPLKREVFGTFLGVYLPSLITMLGAFLFLRLGWIVGHAGLWMTVSVFSFGLILTLITALSISSTVSNMKIGEGGTYYMISRSFGLEVGAAIGMALYIAHTIALCLCILGFSQSFSIFFPGVPPKAIASVTLFFLTALAFLSASLALKTQVVIITLFLGSIATLFFGVYQPPSEVSAIATPQLSFWIIFTALYPALTGIEAGCAMSGDLKSPKHSIILGTISVTITGYLFYIAMTLLLWKKVPLEWLKVDSFVLKHLSGNNIFAMYGLWAVALSSALGCLLSAPRTLKAMSEDGLFRWWKTERSATLLTAFTAYAVIYFGSIQSVVPLLTMVLLIVYGSLNLATAVEEFIGNPSWRPTFRVFPYLSLVGASLSFLAMLSMSAGQAFLACFFILLLYIFVKRKNVGNKWEDLRESILFSLCRYAVYRLAERKPSARSWRPNFLVFSETGGTHSSLLAIASQMTDGRGFLTLASVLKRSISKIEEIERWEHVIKENLKKNQVEALVEVTLADSVVEGIENIITNYGVGSLVPNTVVLGEGPALGKILEISARARRNVLIVRGNAIATREEVDIWWDDEWKPNSELMVFLAHLLVQNTLWRNAKITIKTIVKNEKAFDERKKYFEEFSKNARLNIESEIFIEEEDKIDRRIVQESTARGIVLLSLDKQHLKEIHSACFVRCKQEIDLTKILV